MKKLLTICLVILLALVGAACKANNPTSMNNTGNKKEKILFVNGSTINTDER